MIDRHTQSVFVVLLIVRKIINAALSISFLPSVFNSRPSSPQSDSELVVKPQESSGPQMQWNWGGFPTVWQDRLTHTDVHVLLQLSHAVVKP